MTLVRRVVDFLRLGAQLYTDLTRALLYDLRHR